MRFQSVLFALCFLSYAAVAGGARPLLPAEVPEPLTPWVGWVLWDQEKQTCPYTDGNPADRLCVLPARLELDLDSHGGRFALAVQVHAADWAGLPGDTEHWPQDVQVDGKPVAIGAEDDRPGLRLGPGPHRITGRFGWDRLPESLSIPEHAALIALTIDRKPIPIPAINDRGQLWISDGGVSAESGEAGDSLRVEVYRRIADGVPVEITTHLDLDVSGRAREIVLQGVLLEHTLPLRVSGVLPARLEPDGRLRLQVRPGHWPIEIAARYTAPVTAVALPGFPEPWPREEVWVFEAQPAVRLAEIEGVPPVDPRQTELPEAWKSLPAYRLEPGAIWKFREIRRGDPEPEPDSLTLNRRLWLDFDGRGYTVNDRIGGLMTRGWRLNALPGMALGRVSLDGQPQSITRDEATGGIGVEVRRGRLDLSADSRLPGSRTLPATGWDPEAFRELRTELNLPPGWRLFTTTGVDVATGTWTASWTLLDLFLVLIGSLAVARLWNRNAGAYALVTLVLLWQEPGAPAFVWLNLLAATALLRVLPLGRAAAWMRAYRNLVVLALILIAVPFMVDQIRLGFYPQLARPWPPMEPRGAGQPAAMRTLPATAPEAAAPAAEEAPADGLAVLPDRREAPRRALSIAPKKSPPATPAFLERDPNAVTQTGPGLPQWQWTRIGLNWNGPVAKSQEIGLVLLSPGMNLALNLARVLLLLGLAWLLVGGKPGLPRFRLRPGAPLLLLPLLFFLPEAKADFPSPELLDDLRTRLLAPPECLPHCAEIPRLRLETTAGELRATLEIHVQARIGVPLPARLGFWMPSRAEVDGRTADGLFRSDDGLLWMVLDSGRHLLTLSGPLPSRAQIPIPLPLKPRRVEAAGTGWRVDGIRDNGVPEVQLQLVRLDHGQSAGSPANLEARPLPPFLAVERTLQLGLDWRVATVVRRLSPADSPIAVEIPLLPGEKVVTPGLHVKDQGIAVNMLPGQADLHFDSVLERQPSIRLEALRTTDWTEIWRADISPIWHLRSEGLVVVHHQDPAGNWLPEWRPWAGEAVTLIPTRPAGVPGKTLTLDGIELELSPGERAGDASLSLNWRSSQGGRHDLQLPEGAVLQSVMLDGALQPIRQQGRSVSLPIRPGAGTAILNWRSGEGIRSWLQTPEVDLGMDCATGCVNAVSRISLGRDRWVLLAGGPLLGPAVLFWGVLAAILLLAFGLSRIPASPLRFRSWALLLVGLSQVPVAAGTLVTGWLLALAWRKRAGKGLGDFAFNVLQSGLALGTVAALAVLLFAVQQGLLGDPAMQIAGNGSDAYHLRWYQDRSDRILPRPWVVSGPIWAYRALMLAWALWLAYSLLDWLRWGWSAFAADGLWRARKRKPKSPANGNQEDSNPA